MRTDPLSLGDFIGTNAVDREVADLGMRLAWPILQKARLGRFERSGDLRLDVEAFRDGIETATGLQPTSIFLLMQANVFAAKSGETRYGDLVDFNDSLGIKLLNANWKRIKDLLVARYGHGNYDAFHDGLWASIRRDVALPLRFQFWDDPGETPISSAGEALATSLYYLLVPAALGDRAQVERMSPLIKLLAKAIPIGQIKDKPGAWLVVAPSE
jgi:hypothetical protein